jgi:hypothetical protein
MSVLLGSSGASVILGSSGGGVVLSTAGETKSVIQSSDFTYLGAFRLPESFQWQGAGFAHRYVDGDLRFFSVNNGAELVEFDAPASLASGVTTAPIAAVNRNWGSLYTTLPGGWSKWGIHWDSTDARLYWTIGSNYESDPDTSFLGCSVLDDGAGTLTKYGKWKLTGRGQKMALGGMVNIPSDFATAYTSGRRLGLGFGGYHSLTNVGPASLGPALCAVDPPSLSLADADTLPAFTELVGYPSGVGDRVKRFTTDIINYFDSAASNRVTWNCSILQSGVWIDTPTKHGVLFGMCMDHMAINTTVAASPTPTTTSATLTNAGDLAAGDVVWMEASGQPSHGYVAVTIATISGNNITFPVQEAAPDVGGWCRAGGFYAFSTLWWSRGSHYWYVYDPADLASVATGAVTQDAIQPLNGWSVEYPHISYPIPGGNGFGPKPVTAMTYDATTQRLYVMWNNAWTPEGWLEACAGVHVYQVS